MPKDYDVEKQGHSSAGRMPPLRSPRNSKTPPNPSANYENEADVEHELPK
jgi:hypothetical protein